MLTQRYISTDHLFSLDYPRVWDMEIHNDIPAFFDPVSGSGALQVLAIDLFELNTDIMKKELIFKSYPYLTGAKLLDKMAIFLHMQEIEPDLSDLKIYSRNGISFIPYEYSVNGRFYMSVMMQKNNVVLLAIYNSASQPDSNEAQTIGEIIKSIEIESNN